MITSTQKIKLRKLIDEYREAILEAAFAGTCPPDEAQDLRATETEAKARVERYICLIAKTPDDKPIEAPTNPEIDPFLAGVAARMTPSNVENMLLIHSNLPIDDQVSIVRLAVARDRSITKAPAVQKWMTATASVIFQQE